MNHDDIVTAVFWALLIPLGFILGCCLLAVLFGEEI